MGKPLEKLKVLGDDIDSYIPDIYNLLYCLSYKYIIEKQISMEEEKSIATLGQLVNKYKHLIDDKPKKRVKKASDVKPMEKLIFNFEEDGKTLDEEQLHPAPKKPELPGVSALMPKELIPKKPKKKTKLFGDDVIVE